MGRILRTVFGLALGWVMAGLAGLLGRFQHSPMERRTQRRTFIRNAALGAVGSVTALGGLGFGLLLWPNKTGAFGSERSVSAADVPPVDGTPYRDTGGHFYLAHNQDGLLALWWKCPHLGCTVPWIGPASAPNAYQCPCHGSMYDYNGVRTGGPAPRPMDLMKVTVESDGSVTVDTGDITTRTAYDKSQAVPYPA